MTQSDSLVIEESKPERQHPVNRRQTKRLKKAKFARQQRKGQRAHTRNVLAAERERDHFEQIRLVVTGQTSANEHVIRNVTHDLEHKGANL